MGGVQTLIFLSQSGNDEVKVFPCIKKKLLKVIKHASNCIRALRDICVDSLAALKMDELLYLLELCAVKKPIITNY